jgi:hypothetical protein
LEVCLLLLSLFSQKGLRVVILRLIVNQIRRDESRAWTCMIWEGNPSLIFQFKIKTVRLDSLNQIISVDRRLNRCANDLRVNITRDIAVLMSLPSIEITTLLLEFHRILLKCVGVQSGGINNMTINIYNKGLLKSI